MNDQRRARIGKPTAAVFGVLGLVCACARVNERVAQPSRSDGGERARPGVPSNPSPTDSLSDRDIVAGVTAALSGIVPERLQVHSRDGIVRVAGQVATWAARDDVAGVATTIRGVRAVVSEVEVAVPWRPDHEIAADVRRAIRVDPALAPLDIHVTAENGRVTLTGPVMSDGESDLAARAAKSVPGVAELDLRLEMIPEQRSAEDIRQEVLGRLDTDVTIDASNIDADVRRGVLTLRGTVRTLAEKIRAFRRAQVRGVERVDDRLEVTGLPAETLSRVLPPAPSDGEIRNAVRDAWDSDTRIRSVGPLEIAVSNGSVTLRGAVANADAKYRAEEDARNTVGVVRVLDLLSVSVSGDVVDDRVLEDRILSRLLGTKKVSSGVDVEVLGGHAYLLGTLCSDAELGEAQRVAANEPGVVAVTTHVVIANCACVPGDSTCMR